VSKTQTYGREFAELCKSCKNIQKCSPYGYVCPALRTLWGQSQKTVDEAKQKFIVLRRVFALWKASKYSDRDLLYFLAGWCQFAPQEEDAELLTTLG